MNTHQGEVIEKLIRRDGHSLTDVAAKLGVNRRSLYNWFTQKDLKQETIYKIGHVIQHDFSIEFPDIFSSKDFIFNPASTARERFFYKESEVNHTDTPDWREKYIDLLEKFNDLLAQTYKKEKVA
jgi:AcrR family transcriptional regulator